MSLYTKFELSNLSRYQKQGRTVMALACLTPFIDHIPVELMKEMRSSVIFMGALLSRCGDVTISQPGG